MELKPLTHFFNKRIYVVPDYQRGYSWQSKDIRYLLNDLKHSIQLDSDHYTGTITIHKQDKGEKIGISNYEKYNIVDGQQRFTTITLILSYLIKTLSESKDKEIANEAKSKEAEYIICKKSYLFRYAIDKVSEAYYKSIILEKENLSTLDENLYTRNLKNAKKTIKNYFKEDAVKGMEIDFLQGIEDRFKFNEYIVKNTAEIGVVFETMNNRGIDLSNLEIVKNRLLYLTSKISIQDEEHLSQQTNDNINVKWAQILANLTLPTRVLDENSFLSNHWIIYKGWTTDNQAKTEILNEDFTIENMLKDKIKMIKKINNYVDSLAVTSLHWRFINYPTEDRAFVEIEDDKLRKQVAESFNRLNRLSNSTVRPLLLSFFGLMKKAPKELLEMVDLAEIFSFRLFSMNKKRSDTGKNDIYRNCRRFHKTYQKGETIELAKFYLAWYIDNHGDDKRFNLEIEDLFNSDKKEGYYSWSGLHYFLYEYEEFKRAGQDNKIGFEFASQRAKSIEHILPQNYKKHWKSKTEGLNKKGIKKILHSLGNLVLIAANKNSKLKDSDFTTKKSEFKNGTYSEIEIANNNSNWSVNKIEKREKALLKFMKHRWRVDDWLQEDYPHPENIIEDNEITDQLEDEEIQ